MTSGEDTERSFSPPIIKLYFRPIDHSHLVAALSQVKASVSQEDLELYLDWDRKYGASK